MFIECKLKHELCRVFHNDSKICVIANDERSFSESPSITDFMYHSIKKPVLIEKPTSLLIFFLLLWSPVAFHHAILNPIEVFFRIFPVLLKSLLLIRSSKKKSETFCLFNEDKKILKMNHLISLWNKKLVKNLQSSMMKTATATTTWKNLSSAQFVF